MRLHMGPRVRASVLCAFARSHAFLGSCARARGASRWALGSCIVLAAEILTMRFLHGLLALLLASHLVGCAESPAGVEPFDLAGTSWSLLSVETSSALLQPSSGAAPTLTFTDEAAEGRSGWFRFRAHGGCNIGGGIYRTDERPLVGEASLDIDGLAWTDMACPEPEVMALEAEYFAGLAEAGSVEALAYGLRIRSDDSTLIFEPISAPP